MDQNPLIAWLKETLQRFATKSPKFFRIWQIVAGIATALTGLPALLAYYNIPLPEFLTVLQNKYAGFFALGLFIMSLLPSQPKIVAVDPVTGAPLSKTNEKALPYTARHEEKRVEAIQRENAAGLADNPVNRRNDPNSLK